MLLLPSAHFVQFHFPSCTSTHTFFSFFYISCSILILFSVSVCNFLYIFFSLYFLYFQINFFSTPQPPPVLWGLRTNAFMQLPAYVVSVCVESRGCARRMQSDLLLPASYLLSAHTTQLDTIWICSVFVACASNTRMGKQQQQQWQRGAVRPRQQQQQQQK